MFTKFVDSLTHFADRWRKTSQRMEATLHSYDPELTDSTEDAEPLDSTESQEEIQRQATLEEENRKRQYYRENKWIATDDSSNLGPTLTYTGDVMELDFASFLRYVLKRYGAYTQWTHPFARHISVIQIQRLVHITRLLLLDTYPQAPDVVKHLLDQIGGLEIPHDQAPQVLLDTFSIPSSVNFYYHFEEPNAATAYSFIPLFDPFIEQYALYDLDGANEIQARFEARGLPVPDKLTSDNIGTIVTVLPEFSRPDTRLLDTLMIRCAHYLLSRGLTEDLNLIPTAIFHMVQGMDWGRSYFVQYLIPNRITFQFVDDRLTLSHLTGVDLNQWLTPDYVFENAYTRYSLSELDDYYGHLEAGDLEALEAMICQTLSPEGDHTWRSWQAQEAPFSLTKGLGALYRHILSRASFAWTFSDRIGLEFNHLLHLTRRHPIGNVDTS